MSQPLVTKPLDDHETPLERDLSAFSREELERRYRAAETQLRDARANLRAAVGLLRDVERVWGRAVPGHPPRASVVLDELDAWLGEDRGMSLAMALLVPDDREIRGGGGAHPVPRVTAAAVSDEDLDELAELRISASGQGPSSLARRGRRAERTATTLAWRAYVRGSVTSGHAGESELRELLVERPVDDDDQEEDLDVGEPAVQISAVPSRPRLTLVHARPSNDHSAPCARVQLPKVPSGEGDGDEQGPTLDDPREGKGFGGPPPERTQATEAAGQSTAARPRRRTARLFCDGAARIGAVAVNPKEVPHGAPAKGRDRGEKTASATRAESKPDADSPHDVRSRERRESGRPARAIDRSEQPLADSASPPQHLEVLVEYFPPRRRRRRAPTRALELPVEEAIAAALVAGILAALRDAVRGDP